MFVGHDVTATECHRAPSEDDVNLLRLRRDRDYDGRGRLFDFTERRATCVGNLED